MIPLVMIVLGNTVPTIASFLNSTILGIRSTDVGFSVRGRRKWGKHTAVRFTVEDEPQRVWTELPVWMFDRAVCSRMRLTD